ncbi:MAG: thermonuclease family protein [Nitrosopumilus sp.]|nr:thermonuclease family protein [Nitrosopumilus sp.]
MNKKLIGLAIIPIVGLIFIILTPNSELNISDDKTTEHSISISDESLEIPTSQYSLQECSGSTKCFVGHVTKILDGNAIHVDDQYVRFALASAPGLNGYGGMNSKNFIETICPVGSQVLVDEDDGQPPEGHSRIIGVIHCNDMILNKELLDSGLGYLSKRFCDSSEFASSLWAQRHGCEDLFSEQYTTSQKSSNQQ